jgi:hypothetical protein
VGLGPLLSAQNLLRADSPALATLLGCQDREIQLQAARRFMKSNELDEMLLAGLRAATLSSYLPETQWQLYDLVYWTLRWSGLDPQTSVDMRRAYLQHALVLVRALEDMSQGPELLSFHALRADLLMDLAGLDGEGSAMREARLHQAKELLDVAYPNRVALWLERCEPLAWWRFVRLRAATGNREQVKEACKAFRAEMLQGDFRRELRESHAHYFKNDPLAADLDAFASSAALRRRIGGS